MELLYCTMKLTFGEIHFTRYCYMAQKSIILKVNLHIADIDRNYYNDLSLTLAQHPSETGERVMVRLLAFALNANENLQFTKGLSKDVSDNDVPAIWQKTLTGEIEKWIDVGLPSEKRIKKACNRAKKVCLYAYGGRAAQIWREQTVGKLDRFTNLEVINLPYEATQSMGQMVKKNMGLQCTIQDGLIWMNDSETNLLVEPEQWKQVIVEESWF